MERSVKGRRDKGEYVGPWNGSGLQDILPGADVVAGVGVEQEKRPDVTEEVKEECDEEGICDRRPKVERPCHFRRVAIFGRRPECPEYAFHAVRLLIIMLR